MRMLQSILFATDFHPSSKDAIRVTARLAKAFDARISVFHVLEHFSEDVVAHFFRRMEGDVLLLSVRHQFAEQEVTVAEASISSGSIADSIAKKAAELDVDLIVVGSGGCTSQQTVAVGPVAQAVIEHARQPVLTVRSGASDTQFQTILCPVDHSRVSRRGLRNAIRLARVFGSRLVVTSVVPDVSWLTAAVETREVTNVKAEYENQWCEELKTFLASVDFEGVAYTKELKFGVPHEQIIASANEHHADLIIMGATGRTGLLQVLVGSTTRRLLRVLPCSLLTVKQEDVVEELFEADLRQIASLMAEGRALNIAGCYELAATKFRQVLARNPFHLEAVESLAEAYEHLNRPHEAESCHRRAKHLRSQA